MVIVGMLSWWYTSGWRRVFADLKKQFIGIFDYFSIDLLIKTLFSPYRQISAGRVNGPIGVQIRALFDLLLSRAIGAALRTIVMMIGIVTLALVGLFSMIGLILWALVPILPILGLIAMLIGWMPWII